VLRYCGALVTGGLVIGLLGIWQNVGHKIPAQVYWAIAIVALLISFFKAWNEQVNAREVLEVRPAAVSAREWKELASQFKQMPNGARADWYQSLNAETQAVMAESWDVRGNTSAECEALCKNAGAMLLRSPHILPRLSDRIRTQPDHIWRWLYFLKESRRAVPAGIGEGFTRVGNVKTTTACESIENLASVSATACMECSADEI
jgi:hypothetical protein